MRGACEWEVRKETSEEDGKGRQAGCSRFSFRLEIERRTSVEGGPMLVPFRLVILHGQRGPSVFCECITLLSLYEPSS